MMPQDCLDAITAAYPCPVVSGYERAFWLCECRRAARWIERYTDAELRRQVYAIEEAGIISDTYEIIPIERQESRVNLSRLKEKEPDVFAELVHIRASDAQKIVGRKTLYEMAKEKIGAEAIAEYEQVNVVDLEKAMLSGKSAQFIETGVKITDWAVLEIQEDEP